ncbi:hypothetical protein IPP24_02925 [Candidatus Saccharibacteria bacterium]|nr:MAG: hypothetical protein IPP24_02925 [Candidatus Saccharibacteria bacterium]
MAKSRYRIVSERSAMRTRRDVFVGDIVDQLLSDGFMQPGRGIDDSSGASGAVEIFFSACSTDQEVNEATRVALAAQYCSCCWIDATLGYKMGAGLWESISNASSMGQWQDTLY